MIGRRWYSGRLPVGRSWLAVLGLAALCLGAMPGRASSEPTAVALLEIEGAIGPATVDYVARSFAKALEQGMDLIVLRMDTPGGLADSMRVIIKEILASPVPVVGFVAPAGAHAASAGTYILFACHVAAMAPGTNLGAATPVQIGGGTFPSGRSPEQPEGGEKDGRDEGAGGDQAERKRPGPSAGMEDKIVNDAVAYIRSLAELRGHNAEWAERAVREAASLSAQEALKLNVIDLIAADLDELLKKLDGRQIAIDGGALTLDTDEHAIARLQPDWRTELLGIITDPNVAYILMLIGIYGIIFELYNPGFMLPGVIGAISLVLALYAFQVLPVNYAGLALIGLGVAMMFGEMLMPSFGALGIGGIIAFVVGSIMLIDIEAPGYGISWQLIGGVALAAASMLLVLMTTFARSRQRPVVTGREEMIGSQARVIEWHGGAGRVRLHGEIWHARGPGGLQPDQTVRVVGMDGLTLEVEACARELSTWTLI